MNFGTFSSNSHDTLLYVMYSQCSLLQLRKKNLTSPNHPSDSEIDRARYTEAFNH